MQKVESHSFNSIQNTESESGNKSPAELNENKETDIFDSGSLHRSPQPEKRSIAKIVIVITVCIVVAIVAKELTQDSRQCFGGNFDKVNKVTTKNGWKYEQTPYPGLTLVHKPDDKSPKEHYFEVASYLKKQKKSKIYIHSAPVNLVLIIGEFSDANSQIILAWHYERKDSVKKTFEANNLQAKLILQASQDSNRNMETSDFIVTTNNEVAKLKKRNNFLFILNQSSYNPSVGYTSQLEISNCQSQLTPVLKPYINYGSFFIQKAQGSGFKKIKKVKNPLGPLSIVCNRDDISDWNPSRKDTLTLNGLKMESVPYPEMMLVQDSSVLSPTYHYFEVLAYLQHNPIKDTVYIHSSSVYLATIIAAASAIDVVVVVSSQLQMLQSIETCYVFNRLRSKFVTSSANDKDSIQKANLVVTNDVSFVSDSAYKRILLEVTKSVTNPSKSKTFKLQSVRGCQSSLVPVTTATLDMGMYLILA